MTKGRAVLSKSEADQRYAQMASTIHSVCKAEGLETFPSTRFHWRVHCPKSGTWASFWSPNRSVSKYLIDNENMPGKKATRGSFHDLVKRLKECSPVATAGSDVIDASFEITPEEPPTKKKNEMSDKPTLSQRRQNDLFSLFVDAAAACGLIAAQELPGRYHVRNARTGKAGRFWPGMDGRDRYALGSDAIHAESIAGGAEQLFEVLTQEPMVATTEPPKVSDSTAAFVTLRNAAAAVLDSNRRSVGDLSPKELDAWTALSIAVRQADPIIQRDASVVCEPSS